MTDWGLRNLTPTIVSLGREFRTFGPLDLALSSLPRVFVPENDSRFDQKTLHADWEERQGPDYEPSEGILGRGGPLDISRGRQAHPLQMGGQGFLEYPRFLQP